MDKPVLRGVFVPITTPFDANEDISLEALQANLNRWCHFDLAGFVVFGSTGEFPSLSEKEKVQVWKAARDMIPGDRVMIAGVGCESTRSTIALAARAADAGADAALVVTPSYYHGLMSDEALSVHYHTIADASPIPVVIYNVPRFTGVDISVATVVGLAKHPNIIGIKESSGNLAKVGQIAERTDADFYSLSGAGSTFFLALAMGADGGVLALANLAPAELVDIYRLHAAGDWQDARKLQLRLISLNNIITTRLGAPGVKLALDIRGYYGGPVRSPLRPPPESDRAALRALLAEAELYNEPRSYGVGGGGA